MSRLGTWAREWIETLRVAPPLSRRRREIIMASRDIGDPSVWMEVERPDPEYTCSCCGSGSGSIPTFTEEQSDSLRGLAGHTLGCRRWMDAAPGQRSCVCPAGGPKGYGDD